MHSSTSTADQMPTPCNSAEPHGQRNSDSHTPAARPAPQRISLTVELSLHSMNGLMDILVTISRIGAQIDFVSAQAHSVILSVSAKPFVIKRVPFLLRELIDVLSVREV